MFCRLVSSVLTVFLKAVSKCRWIADTKSKVNKYNRSVK